MADYFQSQPNFTNPSYATPEQLAQQRAYAAELTKRSGENVNRPAGAIANMVTALTAGLTRNNADAVQQQAAAQNSRDISAIAEQLQNGQKPDAATMARIYANPMAAPEHRAMLGKLLTPELITSGYGQPGYASPGTGVNAPPIRGPYTPSATVSQAAEGVSTSGPQPAPTVPLPIQRTAPLDAVSPQGGIFGGMNSRPSNWPSPTPGSGGGGQAPGVGTPPAPAPVAPVGNAAGGYTGPMTLDQLAAKGREFAAQKAYTQGTAGTQTEIAKQDLEASAAAPVIKRVAGTMLDDLRTHGDKMTFGPTAEWTNNIKRLAANYAPGLMKNQLEGLASADSFDKMSAQLTSLLSKGGGTDAQLFNNMRSVPGSHNSKEGAEALLKMTMQVADQQQALRQVTQGAKTPQEYEAMRNEFYARNPIINPITGNPIKLDIEAEQKNTGSGGFKTGNAKILSVRPAP